MKPFEDFEPKFNKKETTEEHSLEVMDVLSHEPENTDEMAQESEEQVEESADERRRLSKRKKILLIVLLAIVILITTVAVSAVQVVKHGEADLKEAGREGRYMLYNGREYRYNEDIINFLFIGVDKDIPMEEKRISGRLGLADVIVVVSMDTEKNTMKIISIPRDTMTMVMMADEEGNEISRKEMQLVFQYAYGYTAEQSGKMMVETVSKLLYETPIQKYCAMNFEAIPVINDTVGGVEVTVLEDMRHLNWLFTEGNTVLLEGDMALQYIRERDTYTFGSNMMRMERQKQYMMALLSQTKKAIREDVTVIMDLYNTLGDDISTDVTTSNIAYLAPELLELSLDEEGMFTIPGEVKMGEAFEEYHVDEEALKQMVINVFYEEVKEPKEAAEVET